MRLLFMPLLTTLISVDYLKQIDAALHQEKSAKAPAWAWAAMPDETDYTQVKKQARLNKTTINKDFSR